MDSWKMIGLLLMIVVLQGCAGSTYPVSEPAVGSSQPTPKSVNASPASPVVTPQPVMEAKKPKITMEVTKTLPGKRPADSKAFTEQVGAWVYIRLSNSGNAPGTERLAVNCEGQASADTGASKGSTMFDGTLNPGESVERIFWMQGTHLAPSDINCTLENLANRSDK